MKVMYVSPHTEGARMAHNLGERIRLYIQDRLDEAPIRLGEPKPQPSGLVQKLFDAAGDNLRLLSIAAKMHHPYRAESVPSMLTKEYLAKFNGESEELGDGRLKYTWQDTRDGRRVDMVIAPAAGDYYRVEGVYLHVVRNGINGVMKPLHGLAFIPPSR